MARSVVGAIATLMTLATSVPVYAYAAEAEHRRGSDWLTVLRTKDIDGDGRDDVVRIREVGGSMCAVQVRTASGEVDQRVVERDLNGCRWHGAAPVDSDRGADISVMTSYGAHATFFTLFTWRGDELRVLRSPDGDRDWAVDGAATVSVGVARRVTDDGPRVVLFEAFLDGDSGQFSGTRTRYAYRSDHWVELGRRAVRMSQERALRHSGWHVPGLPR